MEQQPRGADLYEQMRSYGSSNATPHEGGKGVAQHNLDKLHLHDPLSFLWRSLYFASLRHRAFITEQWFTYTGSCETPRVRGLTRLLRLPRSPTNSSDPISPAVGHNMPYAQLPIVHCPQLSTKAGTAQINGVNSFSVIKEESCRRGEREQ